MKTLFAFLLLLTCSIDVLSAPIPKTLRRMNCTFPDIKTASNETLVYWSNDYDRWHDFVEDLEPGRVVFDGRWSPELRWCVLRNIQEERTRNQE
jgi:hypothetical protein